MKVQQCRWSEDGDWAGPLPDAAAQLVLAFGDRAAIACPGLGADLAARWPAATIMGCATIAGFYSYGEISPFTPNARCELHNQTMTVTTFSER